MHKKKIDLPQKMAIKSRIFAALILHLSVLSNFIKCSVNENAYSMGNEELLISDRIHHVEGEFHAETYFMPYFSTDQYKSVLEPLEDTTKLESTLRTDTNDVSKKVPFTMNPLIYEYRYPDYDSRKYDTMAQRARDEYVARLKLKHLGGTERPEDARAGGAAERPESTWEARLQLSQTQQLPREHERDELTRDGIAVSYSAY